MIKIKEGVDISGCGAPILIALIKAEGIYSEKGHACTVISASEQTERHAPRSPHCQGNAIDIRIKHVPEEGRAELVRRIRASVGSSYLVIREGPSNENEHLRIQHFPQPPVE